MPARLDFGMGGAGTGPAFASWPKVWAAKFPKVGPSCFEANNSLLQDDYRRRKRSLRDGFSCQRQHEGEGCAVAEFAAGMDGTAVRANNVLDDSQAQAGPTGFARTRVVDAIKAFEEARQVLAGDARAKVADVELEA